MICKIEPKNKKSIIQKDHFEKEIKGKKLTFTHEINFVTGYALIEEDIKKINSKNPDGFDVGKYEPTDHEYIEECASFWYFDDGFKENTKEEIKNSYEEDGDNGIMELGWFPAEKEVIFLGPLKVTKV